MMSMAEFYDQALEDIGRLNNELINMQRELAKRNCELERLKANLESLVADRTRELTLANKRLEHELAERNRAEAALRATTTQLETLVEVSPLAIAMLDVEDRVQIWNPAAEKIFGWQASEVLQRPNPIVPRENQKEYLALSQQVLAGNPLIETETLRQRKDGSLVPVTISSAPIYDATNTLTGRMAILHDISERKRTEAALRENEEKFRSVITQSNDGIRLIDAQGIVCEWNQALEEITGQKRAEVLGKEFWEVGLNNIPDEMRSPEHIQKFKENIQNLLHSTQKFAGENSIFAIQRPDGSRRLIQTVVSHINLAQGAMLCGIVRDVTELKQREAELKLAHRELSNAYDLTLAGWARALEMREHETAGHSQRVVALAYRLAQKLGMSGDDLVHLQRGALLHDIGKMGIPDHILLKESSLTETDWVLMRQHPQYALRLLDGIPYLASATEIPYFHHERWDGSGYPLGLKGEDIPWAARIFAVVDVWDALVMNRPYRPGWSTEKTRAYLHENAGKQFDPGVVAEFLALLDEIESEKAGAIRPAVGQEPGSAAMNASPSASKST